MPLENIETFRRGLGWRLLNNNTMPPVAELIAGLNSGPLLVAYEGGTFQHAVVYSGDYADHSRDEEQQFSRYVIRGHPDEERCTEPRIMVALQLIAQ